MPGATAAPASVAAAAPLSIPPPEGLPLQLDLAQVQADGRFLQQGRAGRQAGGRPVVREVLVSLRAVRGQVGRGRGRAAAEADVLAAPSSGRRSAASPASRCWGLPPEFLLLAGMTRASRVLLLCMCLSSFRFYRCLGLIYVGV